ncbi:MAG: SRPBCC family protein [Actinomycetota bacterium]|nr:SRPBCC family protein [Actinomycetota bacterium]
MATVTRSTGVSCQRVWEVLCDGWLYPSWVVGASRMRAVDSTWPATGSRLHHSVGVWPLLIDDDTRVQEVDEGRRLLLRARGWPLGEADIELRLEPEGAGTGDGSRCRIVMAEKPAAGPGLGLFNPVADRLLAARNSESLARLAALVEGRSGS